MSLLRSTLFMIVLVISVVLFAPPIILIAFAHRPFAFWLATRWCWLVIHSARWICGIRFRVEGLEAVPDRPLVVMARHESAWETMALMITLPPQVWIVKRELLWVPGFGQCLWALKAIAIDRKAGKSARDQVVEQGTDRLARGLNVIVFPEGTRIAPGERKRYGLGGPMLAVATGTPVLPVAHNAGDCWRRNAFVKVPGEIVLAFGPPIDPAGMTAQALADTTERWIEGRLAAIRGRPIAAGADTGTTAAA